MGQGERQLYSIMSSRGPGSFQLVALPASEVLSLSASLTLTNQLQVIARRNEGKGNEITSVLRNVI